MLTIILAFVVPLVISPMIIRSEPKADDSFPIYICIISVLAAIYFSFVPISGYYDWELVEETELVSLSNGLASNSNRFVYVSLTGDNAYAYRHEINSDLGTATSKEYKTETLVNKNVEEIEDSSCTTPILRKYCQKPKQTFWTFAVLADEKTKYVFYVPEGTISKDVKLN